MIIRLGHLVFKQTSPNNETSNLKKLHTNNYLRKKLPIAVCIYGLLSWW